MFSKVHFLLLAFVFSLCISMIVSCGADDDDDDDDIKEVGEVTCEDECNAALACGITDIYDFEGETQTFDECIDTCQTVHGADGLLEDECEEICQIDYMKKRRLRRAGGLHRRLLVAGLIDSLLISAFRTPVHKAGNILHRPRASAAVEEA